jgi:hypothetical protein
LIVHEGPVIHRDNRFGSGRASAQRAVGCLGVVVAPPFFDDDPGLAERVEELPVEDVVTKAAAEALAVSVLRRAACFDEISEPDLMKRDHGKPAERSKTSAIWI